ncbi:MAG TPA: ABC transporter C-terminal domain-containing protein, partial [Ktedonobacteraceae bacterium]
PGTAPTPAKAKGKRSGKVKERTLEDVEREIEQAEERVRSVEEALSLAALNADAPQLTQLAADYEQVRARVDELLVEWERLAETASE